MKKMETIPTKDVGRSTAVFLKRLSKRLGNQRTGTKRAEQRYYRKREKGRRMDNVWPSAVQLPRWIRAKVIDDAVEIDIFETQTKACDVM